MSRLARDQSATTPGKDAALKGHENRGPEWVPSSAKGGCCSTSRRGEVRVSIRSRRCAIRNGQPAPLLSDPRLRPYNAREKRDGRSEVGTDSIAGARVHWSDDRCVRGGRRTDDAVERLFGKDGPMNWAKLDRPSRACRDGHEQSPIDIRGAHLNKALPALRVSLRWQSHDG